MPIRCRHDLARRSVPPGPAKDRPLRWLPSAVLLLACWPLAAVAQDETPQISAEQASSLIEELGGPTFERRERAMVTILRLGAPMTPHLTAAVRDEVDPELRLRAKIALAQLTVDDLASRISAFLSGDDDSGVQARQWFSGWEQFEELLGDTMATRELFVEVMEQHPEVTESLAGGVQQRSAAADAVLAAVQNALQRRQAPELPDGVALLLPLIDDQVQVGSGYELTILSVFNRLVADARRDGQLWSAVSRLLENWIRRSRMDNRVEVLWYAMQWDLEAAGELALETLDETTDVEVLQGAMMAIARFGQKADAGKLQPLLEDDRPAVLRVPEPVDGQPLQPTIADAALLTIALLHRVAPQQLGMNPQVVHHKVGFLIERVGYTADDQETRREAIERARRWLEGQSPPQPDRS